MSGQSRSEGRVVYIVDGARTPFLKARGKPGPFSASDLAVSAGRSLLARQPFEASDIDEVVIGCTMPSPEEANIARIIGLRLGTGRSVPAWTVQRNCASGLQAIDSAFKDIASGRHDLVLAGGVDAMSRAPLLFNKGMTNWISQWFSSKTAMAKLKLAAQFRPNYLVPVIALMKGLTDPLVNLTMGQTAEVLAHKFKITRADMDEFSAASHKNALEARAKGVMDEIDTLYDTKGKYYDIDDGVRDDSTPEKLAKLRPFFDKKYGAVTPGNSSQVTDGAALLILASEDAVKKYKLHPIAKIVDINWAACDPAQMGLGPVHAVTPMLQRNELGMSDIDYWEINEAFAAQVIACVKAWEDEAYCKEHFDLEGAFGSLNQARLNVDGGAIALGHPVGASGARLGLHMAKLLNRQHARFGVATLCIGGGQGGAILLEHTGVAS